MPNNKIGEADYEIAEINNLWKDVLKHLKKDWAYIWHDEVRQDFEKIEDDSEKIKFILEEFYLRYETGILEGDKEFSDLKNLIKNLDKIKNIPRFTKKILRDLQLIIRDFNDLKKDLSVFTAVNEWLFYELIRNKGLQVKHLLLSFAEGILGSEAVIPYFRDHLNESLKDKTNGELSKRAQEEHETGIKSVLSQSDDELSKSLNRLKLKIKELVENS